MTDVRPQTAKPYSLPVLAVTIYLLITLFLYVSIRKATGGHFNYVLDDPYIHLALAEQLAHGHYGINPAEFSSPSSSILWPYLLIPAAGTRFHAYLPLAWNLCFGSLAAILLGWQVARWPPQVDAQGRMNWSKQALTVLLLVFTANLACLTMVGMEHVLQVLLSICCAIGVIEALAERPIPVWCLAAAVLAPLVRYEDLALTLAVSLALLGLGRWKTALSVSALSLLPLLGFAAYLKSKGLPPLPMSVLLKENALTHASLPIKIYSRLKEGIHLGLIDPERYPVLILTLLFAGLLWHAETRTRRFVYAGATILGTLQLFIGRFGWFARYEVYAVIFLILITLRILAEHPRFLFAYFSLGLAFCASFYIKATVDTPKAALEIYRQQYQLHRFVTGFYSGDYAVNDLGYMSFERRPGAYVLDVYGLGSLEALNHPDKPAAWMDDITTRYRVPLAIVFPQLFHIPSDWTAIGEMCLPVEPIVAAHQCVAFYSTSPANDAGIRAALQSFFPTLPAGVSSHLAGQRDSIWFPAPPLP